MPFRNSVVGGTTLVREAVRSPNFVAGSSGWSINRDGSAEFNDVTVRGSLVIGVSPDPRMELVPAADLPATLTAGSAPDFEWDAGQVLYYNATEYTFWVVGTKVVGPGTPFPVSAKGTYTTAEGLFFTELSTQTLGGSVVQYGSDTYNPGATGFLYLNSDMSITDTCGFAIAAGANIDVPGYWPFEAVTFDADGTFTPANYTGLRAIRIAAQAGGGGGGGAASTGAGQSSAGGGGGGGEWGVTDIFSYTEISNNIAITVGQGGSGGTAGANNGSAGTDSTAITDSGATNLLTVNGGDGGEGSAAGAAGVIAGGAGGGGATGTQLLHAVTGSDGTNGIRTVNSGVGSQGNGGSAHWGGATRGSATDAGANGPAAQLYGGGGAGGHNQASQATNRSGGAGADGRVIVYVYK